MEDYRAVYDRVQDMYQGTITGAPEGIRKAVEAVAYLKKGGQKPISIGTAAFDQGRCLPWAMQTPCVVCEEFCPTSPKAIWVEEVTVEKRELW